MIVISKPPEGKLAVKNIYCDDEGNVIYETATAPQQFVVSEPPSGYKRITNIYYNPDVGDVEVEYK